MSLLRKTCYWYDYLISFSCENSYYFVKINFATWTEELHKFIWINFKLANDQETNQIEIKQAM